MSAVSEAPKGLFAFEPDHCCQSVPDLEASIAWYADILGFAVERRFHVAHIGADGVMLKRGAFRIELFQVPGAADCHPDRRDVHLDLRTRGTKHFAISVRGIDTVVATLKAHGVDFAQELTRMSPARSFAFIRDNSGNLIEILERHDS
jgi:methylmalonyl-CoA/ethylmalonyl-CoA epimerase